MKFIIQRKKSTMTVVTATTRWAPSTAIELTDFLRPELEDGETMPDLELLQKLFGRALARSWNLLDMADDAHVSAAVRYRRLLAARGAAVKALHRGVVDLRRLIRSIFGAEPARRLLGLGGKTSSDPIVLLKQAERAADRLLDAPLPGAGVPPEGGKRNIVPEGGKRNAFEPTDHDRARWAASVKALARILETARARASRAAKELEGAAAERRRAIEGFNAALARVAGWLTGTYRAAGRDDRAETVRPSGRCPGLLLKNERRPPAAPRPEPAPEPVAVERDSPLMHDEAPPMNTGGEAWQRRSSSRSSANAC